MKLTTMRKEEDGDDEETEYNRLHFLLHFSLPIL